MKRSLIKFLAQRGLHHPPELQYFVVSKFVAECLSGNVGGVAEDFRCNLVFIGDGVVQHIARGLLQAPTHVVQSGVEYQPN